MAHPLVTFSEEVVEDLGKPFRLANRRLILTYRGHQPKVELEIFLRATCQSTGIKEIYMAHEVGSTNITYEHTHVVIDCGRAYQTKNCRAFDYQEIHPNIRKIMSAKHWRNCVRYMAKEDVANISLGTYTGGVDDFDIDEIQGCADFNEVLRRFAGKSGDASGLKIIWDARVVRSKYAFTPYVLRPWQQHVWNMLQGPSDARTIFFVVDEAGAAGKSTLVEQLLRLQSSRCATVDLGRPADVFEKLWNKSESGNSLEVILVDCSRAAFFTHEHFDILEKIKNGIWTRTKYQSRDYMGPKPHIVFFTNKDIVRLVAGHAPWLTLDRIRGITLTDMGEVFTPIFRRSASGDDVASTTSAPLRAADVAEPIRAISEPEDNVFGIPREYAADARVLGLS